MWHPRSPLSLVAVLALWQPALGQPPAGEPQLTYPATGKIGPGLEPLDRAVLTMLSRHGIPGASLAVAKDGKLICARGYGWAILAADEHVQPTTLFGLASLSKVFTATAILKLVEQGKLGLDDHPFTILNNIKPLPGAKVDPRLYQITVRQLLNHSGGWDTKKSGDPVNWNTQVQLKRGDRTPIAAEHLIAFTMGIPLDFDPGTDCKYSNFGYIVLGEVIAAASGQSYEKYVQDNVLAPAGVRAMLHPLNGRYFPNEARRYLAGTESELPPWQQKYSDAAGGWICSAVDMVRFLCALDGSRDKPLLSEKNFKAMIALPPPPLKPRENGTHVGLGWDSVFLKEKEFGYYKDGLWFGMRGFMKRKPNGINWVLLFNTSMNPDGLDTQTVTDAVKEVHETMERQEKYPDLDLFNEFR
jgi:CubicO group peptidase (beta-lactamase class C family)